jgi:hypothetical protein
MFLPYFLFHAGKGGLCRTAHMAMRTGAYALKILSLKSREQRWAGVSLGCGTLAWWPTVSVQLLKEQRLLWFGGCLGLLAVSGQHVLPEKLSPFDFDVAKAPHLRFHQLERNSPDPR